MELKNAVAVSLVAVVAAALVTLIARSLDSQAAARLEPQLASIVEELQAIRRQGGAIGVAAGGAAADAAGEALTVYYFHGNTRCATCETIESQSREAVEKGFVEELRRREIVWKTLNYEQPAAAGLAKQFEVQMPVVVVARGQAGEIERWERLDEVWGLVDEKPKFIAYVRDAVRQMLDRTPAKASPPATSGSPAKKPPADLPLPLPPAKTSN